MVVQCIAVLYQLLLVVCMYYLRNFPPPFGWSKDVEVSFGEVSSQQQDQAAVPHKEGVVVSVHF